MGDLSPNFSRREFRSKDGVDGPVDPELVRRLELLRAIIGRPIHIVSGFRSPAHNRRVGGARRSQHLLGKAADLRPGVATVAQAEQAGFRGIGHRDGWALHVDVRARPARWKY